MKKSDSNGMPCDLSCERSVLSCMLMDSTCMEHAENFGIDKTYFYDNRHAYVFNALYDIKHEDHTQPDLRTLHNKLKDTNRFGGYTDRQWFDFLTSLEDEFTLPDNFPQHVHRLNEYRHRRELIQTATNVINDAYDTKRPVNVAGVDNEYHVDINEWIEKTPPPTEYIFDDVLPRGIVGSILAMGGTGKSTMLLYMLIGASLGRPLWDYFTTPHPLKVLGFLGEDPVDMTWRRFRTALQSFDEFCVATLSENLRIICEKAGAILEMDVKGNPAFTKTHVLIKKEIEKTQPDLIVIDPKSMFYGLDENDNSHNSMWLNTLKKLAGNATILFCHHVNKVGRGDLDLNSSRGGSALADGCRWIANLRRIDEATATKYEIEDYSNYIQFKITKNSYAKLSGHEVYFKFNEVGGLERVMLQEKRCREICIAVLDALTSNPDIQLSVRELMTRQEGKRVREYVTDVCGKTSRGDLKNAIFYGLKKGILKTEKTFNGTSSKEALFPC